MASASPIKAVDDFGKDESSEYLPTDVTGVQCHGKIVKNKVAEPYRAFRFPLLFDGRGIDDSWAFAQLIIDRQKWEFCDDFEKSANTYAWRGEKLGVGEKGLAIAIEDDPKLRMELEEVLFM